ncbi:MULTISPECIES: aminoacyl-tRNA hydrolase [unclassified Treponema]|uniref:aminoacyl-tRNA hydrolase n=1 Tax=unclassified Treponema TaxID=2638727 RepID=UPI0020A40097|nr:MULTISPECIES: aminoacyl-tRNA hydrolase [unclassified Treponema]UTC66498.1 aminoacyl-tRNA hydrolase [Treponema sp. OMZ 789]UTC69230.1 aminoacyl-tRNA hydrolase [Treponema sp. OMZ 790]UTC71943.1 aminoacyl-tRNA hydrolase [Treponema sp. OMZ 791]
MIDLIAFLGNYGKKYENTRHNAAWVLCDLIDIGTNAVWQSKFKGQYAKASPSITGGRVIHLLKPETYMNLSGESVISAASFFRLKPENILIVHDELELKPGIISFKWGGGLGGHNGLRSVKSVLNTADFFRLRIGIGRPDFSSQGGDSSPDISGYVLSRFAQSELETIKSQVSNVNSFFKELLEAEEAQTLIKKWAKVLPPQSGVLIS